MSDPIDELFGGELSDFVRRRDELVRQLKKEGDKETAAAVKQLRKPSTVAWAVNQVARRQPAAIDELVEAGRGVHAAQARAVQGKDGSGLRDATIAWRTRVRALAADVARDAGEHYRDEAATTFEAASTSEELAAILKAGRFVTALSPSGFGLQGMPEPAESPTRRGVTQEEKEEPAAPKAPERDEVAIAAASSRLAGVQSKLEKATHRLRRAEQRLDVARQAVADATAAREDAVAGRDAAAEELRQLSASG